jgi:hypothetical protein
VQSGFRRHFRVERDGLWWRHFRVERDAKGSEKFDRNAKGGAGLGS